MLDCWRETRHNEAGAGPRTATMTESRSTDVHRKAASILAILAIAFHPCGMSPRLPIFVREVRVSCRPIARVLTISLPPSLPRRRGSQRHDGVHQRSNSQSGVVARYGTCQPHEHTCRVVSASDTNVDRIDYATGVVTRAFLFQPRQGLFGDASARAFGDVAIGRTHVSPNPTPPPPHRNHFRQLRGELTARRERESGWFVSRHRVWVCGRVVTAQATRGDCVRANERIRGDFRGFGVRDANHHGWIHRGERTNPDPERRDRGRGERAIYRCANGNQWFAHDTHLQRWGSRGARHDGRVE